MNDLVKVEKIENQLMKRNSSEVFPLTPTHRKELRKLRDENVGSMNERLRTLKRLKLEEYKKKYKKEIMKDVKGKQKICDTLNEDWADRIKKMNKLLEERRNLEEKFDLALINMRTGYSDVSKLHGSDFVREASMDLEQNIEQLAKKEFDEMYGVAFRKVQEKLDELVTAYEEAINFGDLQVVKELYYKMKGGDKLFESITKLKV